MTTVVFFIILNHHINNIYPIWSIKIVLFNSFEYISISLKLIFHSTFLSIIRLIYSINISAKFFHILKHYLQPINLLLRMIMPTIPLLIFQLVLYPI